MAASPENDPLAPTLPPSPLADTLPPPAVQDAQRVMSAPLGARFLPLRAHARGGLGEVYVANDIELSREVALKEIRLEYADRAEARERFVREAEVTGQLEHPGVVPVYGMGAYEDGRPYYAMRFIRGQSLKALIEAFHRARASQTNLSGDLLVEFRQLLSRFLAVCQTVHYAHSRQVLHRDLKPDNIMVGDYAETLVVDWGLAKTSFTADSPVNASMSKIERPVTTARSGDSDTLDGSTLGTPEYMSPEQAAGRLDELGPATDIYALGATLYCLLTGRPPIDRREKPDFVQAIEAGDYPPPRKLWPQIAPALEAICLKAMRRDPCKRYATARDLATDIERWLADEPIGVYVEPFTARASRWMRKNPAKVATGITAALLLILATSTIAIVVGRYNQVVAKANEEIRQQKDAAETRRKEAETVTDLLLDSFQSKQGTAVFRLTTFDEVLDRAVASLKSHDELSSPVKRELWTAFGQSYVSIGAYPKAIESLEQAIRLSPNDLSQESLLMRMDLGNSHLFAKQHAEAIEVYEPLLQEMTAHLGPVAQQTHQLSMQLATAYRAVGREDDAIQLARTRYALYRKEVGDSDQRTLDALSNLAFELQTARQLDEAIATTQEGLQIAEQSHGKHGEYALYFLGSLVYLHLDAGRNDEARQFAEQIAAANTVDHATYLASTSTGATLLFRDVTNQWQTIDRESAKLTSHRGLGGRALLALRAGRYKEAREAALALSRIREHAAIEHFTVALASHALGQTDEARTHYLAGERDLAWLKEPAQHLYLYDRLAAEVLAREVQGLLK